MGILFKDILKLSCFDNTTLYSGEDVIDMTEVEGITIIERPDIANWIKGGELLLTSFYSIEENVSAQKKLVEDVALKGAAGIIIKSKGESKNLDQEIVNKGNELKFPIICIDESVKYIEILYPVMGSLLNDQVYRLNYYKECHEKFNKLSLEMKDLSSIVETLEYLVENPVIFFDTEMRVLAYSNNSYSELNITEKVVRKMVYEGAPISRLELSFNNEKYDMTVQSIEVVNRTQAYLGIIEAAKSIDKMDIIALESASNTLKLEMLKEAAVYEAKLRYKGDLMDDLISGNYDSLQNLYDRGYLLGWDLKKNYAISVFNVSLKNTSIIKDTTEWNIESRNTIKTIVDRIAYHHVNGHISLIKGDDIVIFWPIDFSKTINPFDNIKLFGKEVRETIKKRFKDVSVQMGIGCITNSVSDIGRSFREAKDASSFGKRAFGDNSTCTFEELGIYRMLCSFSNRDDLEDFIPNSLKKLREYDNEKNNDLIDTLEMYLKCNLNAVKTAEELYVHYKTIIYRLNRIREISGLNIEDRDQMLEIEVGLKILKIVY